MPNIKPKILVIDDEDSMLKTYRSVLKSEYEPVLLSDSTKALETIKHDNFGVVLLDLRMPVKDGLEVLPEIKKHYPDLEVIMVTAVQDVKSAVAAIRLGAYDYITKPFEAEELCAVVAKALEKRALIKENAYLRQVLETKEVFPKFIGKSPQFEQVLALIKKVAATDSTVLITGESGTGKELAAHAIHQQSERADKPFVVVNCAAIPDSLIEAELFGAERGAYTGAMERRLGKFELADTGTIFLDEIGCLKKALQSKLLRIIQDGVVERVGGSNPLKVDVRLVAATNLDLKEAISRGEFREDLFYRLNVVPIKMPPLKERREDVVVLLEFFLDKFNRELNKKIKGFSQEAIDRLVNYDWPGNVRELQNLVERVVVLADGSAPIEAADLPLESASQHDVDLCLKEATAEFERKYVQSALREARGNQTKAAEILGIHRTTLISKIEQLGLK